VEGEVFKPGRYENLGPAVPDEPFLERLDTEVHSPRHGVPRLEPQPPRMRAAVPGEPPSAARLPLGCVFSSPCPHVKPRCTEAQPELRDATPGHQVACRRLRELRPEQTLAHTA